MKKIKFPAITNYADIFIIILGLLFAYGLLIPFLHYYIDDWYWVWTWNTFKHAGITEYFSTNRPAWGLIYHITLPILSISPILAQLFAFFTRLISTLLFLKLLYQLWPTNRKGNVFSALIFGLYPGFALQSIAITYSHIFLILSAFLLSLIFTTQWIQSKQKYFLFLSMVFSAINLIFLEYFFTLELIRFVVILILLSRQDNNLLRSTKRSLIHYIPYITILIVTVAVRTTLLTQIQTNRYGITFFSNLKQEPFTTIVNLVYIIFTDIFTVLFGSWQPALDKIAEIHTINKTILASIVLCVLFIIIALFYFLFAKKSKGSKNFTQYKELLFLGIMGIFFAGWPFWITDLEITPYYLLSRYTLSFILGVSLLYGLLYSLVEKNKLISSLLIGFTMFTSMFYQMQIMNDFRIETMQNRELMWQMKWRIPDLEENTLVLTTDYPNEYYDVATLASELSTIYPKAPQKYNLPYFMLYSRNIQENYETGIQEDIPIKMNNVTAVFNGSTSQMIAIDYDPAKCVRILDPDLDGTDTNLHEHVQRAAQISNLSLIDLNFQSDGSEMYYFNQEPVNSWCYYFEKADLAKQKKDWQEVIRLYEEALEQGYPFKSERERYPFIEAYAQLGQWDQAYELIEASDHNELAHGLCMLAKRIETTTPDSEEKSNFLTAVNGTLNCQ
jgi:hypothetical protein